MLSMVSLGEKIEFNIKACHYVFQLFRHRVINSNIFRLPLMDT